jgi:hypothetical protein
VLKTLFLQEILLLLVVTAVGAAPASLLRIGDRVGARVAIAPAAGTALSVGILTAVNLFVPLDGALWFVLLPVAAVSVAVALVVAHRRDELHRRSVRVRELAAMGAVVLVALTAANIPLDGRLSHGPMGYGVFDSPGYVSCIDGFTHHTNDVPLTGGQFHSTTPGFETRDWGADWNIADRFCWNYKYQHTGGMAVPAAVGSSVDIPSWQSLTPWMAVYLAIAALGAFLLAQALGGGLLAATGAGLLTGGPALFQIYMDGAAGLLGGLTMLAPLMAVGAAAVLRPTWRLTVLAGLLTAGLQAIYPEMLVLPLAALALAIIVRIALAWRDGTIRRRGVWEILGHLVVFGVLLLALAPRSGLWTVDYYLHTLDQFAMSNGLNYNVRAQYLVGWLAQTRDFYSFAFNTPWDFRWIWQGLLLPEVLFGLALAAVVATRNRRALLLVAFLVMAILQSFASLHRYNCEYCVQRTMLTTIAPFAAFIFVGLVWGLRRPGVLVRGVAAIGMLLLVLTAIGGMRETQKRASFAFMTAYELPDVADKAAKLTKGTVAMEGSASVPLWAWGEQPTTYEALAESTQRRISVPAAYQDWGGFAFFESRPIGHPVYTTKYDYVVSRLGGIETPRRVVYRNGPYQVAERAKPFDVIIARGISADNRKRDKTGNAWLQAAGTQLGLVQGVPTFWISALSPAKAYLRVRVESAVPIGPSNKVPGAISTEVPGGWEICMPVPSRKRLRIAHLPLSLNPAPFTFSTDPHDNAPFLDKTFRVAAVSATTQACPVPPRKRS